MSVQISKASMPGFLKYGLAASASVIAFGAVPVAHAQNTTSAPAVTAQSDKLEEVVVTSRRRAEKLQDVPLTVSAFTASKLQSLAISDAQDLSRFTPGYHFTDYTNGREDRGDFRFMVFRGLNVSNNTDITAASLTFLDGAPVLSNDVLITDALERVEVMKGPQNVYFGRSVMTGAINYITKNPGNEYKGSVQVEVGNYNEYKVDGHIEGPIVLNKLSFALDGELFNKDGDYTNTAYPNQKFGAQNTKSIAATLYATPTDDLSIKLYTNYYTYDDGVGQSVTLPGASGNSGSQLGGPQVATGYTSTCNPGGPAGRVGGVSTGALIGNFYPCGSFGVVPSNLIASSTNYTKAVSAALDHPPGVPMLLGSGYCDKFGTCVDNIATHMIVNYELPDGIKINEITAYHRRDVDDVDNASNEDTSGIPNPLYGNPAFPNAPSYSQFDYMIADRTQDYSTELRVSSADDQVLRWTIGANYVHIDQVQQLMFYSDTGAFATHNSGQQFQYQRADTEGVFGGLYYEPIEGLTFAAEIRWQDDTLTQQGTQIASHIFQQSYYSRTPSASVTYKINPDISVYASYKTGVRPGGFNTDLVILPQALINQISAQTGPAAVAYKQEKLDTYEIGLKGSFFDNTLRANVSAYKGKLRNEQTDTTALTTIDILQYGGRFDVYTNAGNVNIQGVEADAQWKVNNVLELSGTFGWNDTNVIESNSFIAGQVTGNPHYDVGKEMPGSPQYSFTVAADLRDSLTSSLDWFAHADMSYRGKQFIDEENLAYIPSTILVGAQAGVENDTYQVAVWAKNLTNNTNLLGAQISSDQISGSNYAIRAGLTDKRAFGLRFKYKFNAGAMEETKVAAYVPPPVVAAAPAAVAHSYQVFFDFNKSDLTPEATKVVDQAAANAAPAKVTRIDVTGHTDTVGSAAYNMRLSRRRAESVAAELQARGIPSSEIAIFAKGKTDLLVPTADGVREPQNRRVQIVYEGGPTS